MPTKFNISNVSEDEDTRTRKCTVKVGTSGDMKFQTPVRLGNEGVTEFPVYEAYRKIKPETIQKCLQNESYDRKTGNEIGKRCKGRFNILTMEYDSKTTVPSDRMIQALSDIQYFHTDAITTPSWFDLITRKNSVNVEMFKKLTSEYVDAASIRNHKPIIGTIPQSIPPEDIDDVIKMFIDHDITSFMIDSHGRTLISGMWVRTLQRSLEQYRLEKEGILYSINAFQGTVHKNEEYIEAKDFIGFAAGMDLIGWKHSAKYFGPQPYDDTETMGRKFDSSTYNYVKIPCTPKDKTSITEESIREQNRELSKVRIALDDGELTKLLDDKNISKETRSQLRSCKKDVHSTLDNFI